MIKKTLILLACCSHFAYAAESNNPLHCADLPIGTYSVDSFATYEERQVNPNQNDISNFTITQTQPTIAGTVQSNGYIYSFTARCTERIYNGIQELYLVFSAEDSSLIDECSGLFNLASAAESIGSAMYVGGPSLTTGDNNFQACNGNHYGTILPPKLK